MSIDDIHAMVGSIRKNVLDMRVTNIYDLQGGGDGNSKTYILKLHQPPFPKLFLLLESGVRFHTSKYARDASASKSSASLPSQFTMKLRKHLRGKRLVSLAQLEGDRVVDFTFGSDALQCHLILELYAAGNIILTDESYNILSLLRTHKFDENVKVAVKQVYPVQVLGTSADADGEAASKSPKERCIQTTAALTAFVDKWFADQRAKVAAGAGGKKKQAQQTLKQLLLVKDSTFGGLGPVIVEHCIVRAELAPTLKIKAAADFAAIGEEKLAKLLEELHTGWDLLDKLQSEQVNTSTIAATDAAAPPAASDDAASAKHGFIILKDSSGTDGPEQFEEFTPYLYAQHLQAHKKVRAFDTFDEAVDEYFSRFEAEVAQVAKQNAQAAAENKLAKLKKSQQQQLAQLEEVQNQSLKHARLIESNQQDVENVLLVVRSALASGMDWRELEELVRYEQKNGNPVASLIHQLDLEHNRVSILLCDGDDDDDDEDEDEDEDEDPDDKNAEDKQAHVIWIDLALSALGNAREIYAKKKKAGEKAKKATEATERAIQQAEKNTKKTLQKQQMTRHTIYQRRKVMWFEKFHWFLTSENYLVIAGKDAHQNELLVKRYLRKGDVYVHADLHGAATCVVRNRVPSGDKKSPPPPIPVATLEQAGCMSVCRSNAWTSQVIAGAYWVHADQVSKTAPAGEYLTTGSFMIRGKKNYIPPSRLEMGLAIIFRVDESCIANHASAMSVDESEDVEVGDHKQEEQAAAPIKHAEVAEAEQRDAVADGNDAGALKVKETSVAVDPAVDAEEQDGGADDASSRDGKKRLTAKERRDLKKGKTPGATANGEANGSEKKQPQEPQKGKGDAGKKPTSDAPKNVRGKKGKLKKMKKKYADQDEEDRRLRMEALGHSVDSDDKTNADDDDDKEAEDAEEDDSNDNGVAPVKKEVDEEYIRQQREKKEKFLDEQEEEAETADFFDAFTGSLLPNDIVLFALPMCAPYSSLGKYKYKVKLLPGTQKKGKAAKQAMEHFLSSNLREEKQATPGGKPTRDGEQKEEGEHEDDDATPDVDPLVVQRELMKCIPENELVNCLVGPLKISAPGLHAGASGGGKKGGSKKGGSGKKGKK